MEFLVLVVPLCIVAAVIGIIMLIIATNVYLNAEGRTFAKRNAAKYLDALQAKDFTKAATHVSKVVLANDDEKTAWIQKMQSEKRNWRLISYSLGKPDFRTLSGKYTGSAYVSVSVVEENEGREQRRSFALRLVEDIGGNSTTLRVINSPELTDEYDTRASDSFLNLKPVRRDSVGT